jgi:DNA polymerase-1
MKMEKETNEKPPLDSPYLLAYYNNSIRAALISSPNWSLIGTDYSSLEIVVYADDSSDPALLDMIRKKHDLYSATAIAIHDLAEEYSADKKAKNYLGKHKKELRQAAKPIPLGIRYGLESFKLSHDLGVSQQEAERIIYKFFRAYPKLKQRMDSLKNEVMLRGQIQSKAGRIRHIPHVKTYVDEWGREMLEPLKLYEKFNGTEQYESMKKLRKRARNGINNALNFPIQSMAASIVNRAAIAIQKEFAERGLNSYICLQIHDELVVHSPKNEVELAKQIIQDKMENTTKLSVPLEAVPAVGKSYIELKD